MLDWLIENANVEWFPYHQINYFMWNYFMQVVFYILLCFFAYRLVRVWNEYARRLDWAMRILDRLDEDRLKGRKGT